MSKCPICGAVLVYKVSLPCGGTMYHHARSDRCGGGVIIGGAYASVSGSGETPCSVLIPDNLNERPTPGGIIAPAVI